MDSYVGQQFGDYRLTHYLGGGGFADVYLGKHIFLSTQAAVKVLKGHFTDKEIEAFRYEALILARLEHPHIVPIRTFSIAQFGDRAVPFLVMGLAPNGSLDKRHPKGTILPLVTIVSYVNQIAEALDYAHAQKVIHRDIKPANFLLAKDEKILLADFGIAVGAHGADSWVEQPVAGSYPYMAPEQFQAKAEAASDQYALGIVVYQWLCGDPPFSGDAHALPYQHMTTPPPPLRERVPISSFVEAVVLRALAKSPQQRFPSIRAFAVALDQACQQELAQSKTTEEPTRPTYAHRITEEPTRLTYAHHTDDVCWIAWSPDGHFLASASKDKTVRVWKLETGDTILTYKKHLDRVKSAIWSPNGKYIASSGDIKDGTVRIWEAVSGYTTLIYRNHTPAATAISWSPDGRFLASSSGDKTVQVWEAATGRTIITYKGHTNGVTSVAWSLSGRYIASGSWDTTVQLWEAMTGKILLTYTGHSSDVTTLSWAYDDSRIASSGEDKIIKVWDVKTGHTISFYSGHSGVVNSVVWSPNSRYIASGSSDGTVQIWEPETRHCKLVSNSHFSTVNAVAWSYDGDRIASASDDRTVQVIRVWQLIQEEEQMRNEQQTRVEHTLQKIVEDYRTPPSPLVDKDTLSGPVPVPPPVVEKKQSWWRRKKNTS
jgi:eukaryotic-like serine/threonine-protein kinase